MSEAATRVVIVDDHRLVAEGLSRLLASQRDMVVVGIATDAASAVEVALARRPDVLILDVNLPEPVGPEVVRRVKVGSPETQVCALTMHSDRAIVAAMLDAGARGFVVKSGPFEDVLTAIRAVAAGGCFYSSDVAESIPGQLTPSSPQGDALSLLSALDLRVIKLVAEGATSKDISLTLDMPQKKVDYHRKRVMDILGMENVAELTKFAIRQGLVTL